MAKRFTTTIEEVASLKNLYESAIKVQRRLKSLNTKEELCVNIEDAIFGLRDELIQGSYKTQNYKTITIFDPKKRLIHIPHIKDRILHHGICNYFEAFLETKYVFDSYACRKGKGTLKAISRVQDFSRKYRYALVLDIHHHFESMSHEVLVCLLTKLVKSQGMFEVLREIATSCSVSKPNHGLPIGSLMSQHFANLYLDMADHYAKEILKANAYVRFMDDFCVLSNSKTELWHFYSEFSSFVNSILKLSLKPSATKLMPVTEGIPFLGVRIFKNHIRLQRKKMIRLVSSLRSTYGKVASGQIDEYKGREKILGLWAGVFHHNTRNLLQSLL